MNFFILFLLIVIASVSLGSAAELRAKRAVNYLGKISQSSKSKYQSVNSFPASPTYAIVETYSDSECASPFTGQSTLLGTCLVGSTSSSIYSCSDGVLTETNYIDTTCTTASGSPTTIATTTCAANQKVVSCGGSDGTAFPGNPVVSSYNQLSTCQNLISAVSYENGVCLDLSSGPDLLSIKLVWPAGYIYDASTDCTGNPVATQTISTTCSINTITDDDSPLDYGTYSQVIAPPSSTSQPTLQPTLQPTSSGISNLSFGLVTLISAVIVAFRLIKN